MMPGVNPLLRPLDRLMSRSAHYDTRLMKTYVNEPHRIRLLFYRGVAGFVLAVALILGMNIFSQGSWYFTLCSVTAGWLLGRGALRSFGKAQAYRTGWLDGRTRMVGALAESLERGMTVDEWLQGELERDQAVMRWL